VIAVVASKGAGLDQRFWLLDVVRLQVTIPVLVQHIRAIQLQYGAPAFIEGVGGFKGVADSLRAADPRLKVFDAPTRGDKFTKALPAAAAWEHGRVYVPESAPWLTPFLKELREFTGRNDRHDDQVDAFGFAVGGLLRARPAVRRGIGDLPLR
jgi:predicted phage terminase large subunit-like protein